MLLLHKYYFRIGRFLCWGKSVFGKLDIEKGSPFVSSFKCQKNAKENCPMYNSIIQFIEKDTIIIEKLMTEHLLSGNMLRFEEGLMDTIIEFVRETVSGSPGKF